jgi:signal transduction histidine kinase
MDNLINGILQYSRIGRIKGTPTELNIYDLLQEVIDSINAPDPVKFKLLGNFPVIYADRTRIVQIFQNLLSNAVKYMDKPDGNVTVSAEELDDYWLFRVKDTGPGIEEKYFEKIFQIFQTLESRDKRESTGIGLTLVKKIVQLYGGTISVESTVGEGSTFIFTLSKKEVRNEKQ